MALINWGCRQTNWEGPAAGEENLAKPAKAIRVHQGRHSYKHAGLGFTGHEPDINAPGAHDQGRQNPRETSICCAGRGGLPALLPARGGGVEGMGSAAGVELAAACGLDKGWVGVGGVSVFLLEVCVA